MSDRRIVCEDFDLALDDLRRQGFRLDLIYPAEEPHSADLTKGDARVRLTSRPDDPEISGVLPPFVPEFVLTRAGASAGRGRAGMFYRDLIPGRLGGRYVASRISIPNGGSVADWVHFHHIRLQMIFVLHGWVRVVYEDQGEPFVMREGDLVLQPPQIRHRVLESSAGLEVIEISAPAVHATFSDHALELPNGDNPGRDFDGQHFVHHVAANAPWTSFGDAHARRMGIAEATGSLAEARVFRPGPKARIDFEPHEGELVFGFVLDGRAVLDFSGAHALNPGDAVVIPPRASWRLAQASPDLRLLHVTTGRLD